MTLICRKNNIMEAYLCTQLTFCTLVDSNRLWTILFSLEEVMIWVIFTALTLSTSLLQLYVPPGYLDTLPENPAVGFLHQRRGSSPSPVLKFPRACFIRTYIMGNSLNAFQNKAINREQFYSEWSISIYFVGCKQQKGKVLHRRE